ncbi:MAG: AbrB family transcriptional regulator [Actinobacteria bacterium RBG_19FT_COMBO_54_7]|uniref:AbrB family transcriptional regulator n=1 Tax=Candidatus Solincola sediminis TaxID=1797199 RepID=A0A1F2WMZ4_9ACTN|nr:MAG: AbrB family transcriptional regulator [Candidatus Solincola sediminis]OFW58217.1 MAG: AbrB family transcriptional regulator [Candidatus Solincola sediminis]OFW65223.1 MAG: AbrB family transcriptional regulator [Actinobacteria bacterium RBG_19FT_COMBO_54_7]
MAANAKGNCSAGCEIGQDTCCCKVDALISVDERGQMVLPKDIREKAGIKAGDKLALISWQKEGEVYCITLIKVEGLTEIVKDRLGPLLKEMF